MILGIGSDLIDIRRVNKLFSKYGEKAVNRFFTDFEKKSIRTNSNLIASFAKRIAAKEACAKALGIGIFGEGLRAKWLDIEVRNLESGQPILNLYGNAKTHLEKLIKKNLNPFLHLTLSDEFPYAMATVVIEAR